MFRGNEQKFPWPRRLGELAVRLEKGEEPTKELLREIHQTIAEVIEELPEREHQTAKLAILIQKSRQASSLEEIENILTEGMKIHKVRTLTSSEVAEAKKDEEKRKFLVFLNQETWGPAEWQDKGHRALIINIRQALGRVKRGTSG